MGKGLFVVLAQENKSGVRSQVKGLFPKAEKVEIHQEIPLKRKENVQKQRIPSSNALRPVDTLS
jgi:hypothetical protein